jgi:hypothetical protein
MGSQPTEPAVSYETAKRLVFSEMSGPLSDKLDGTAPHAQVTTPAYRQESVLKIRQFLLQVLVSSVPSWSGRGRFSQVVGRPNLRTRLQDMRITFEGGDLF